VERGGHLSELAARPESRQTEQNGNDESLIDAGKPPQEDAESGGGTSKRRAIFTFPLVVLALVNFVDHVDMAILRGVLPLIGEEFSASDRQLGLLGFAFIFVNILASIPAGWMADNYRRGRVIGYTLASWSALSALSAAAVNYASLLGARAVMGFGQAIDDPASTSLIGDYFPPHTRGRVFSVQQVMIFAGSGVGLALAGLVGSQLGWRWAFLLVGTPGSLVAFMAFRLKEPKRGAADLAALDDKTVVYDGAGDGPDGLPADEVQDIVRPTRQDGLVSFVKSASADLFREIVALFRIRTMRYILTGAATLLFTVQGIGYWLAVFHQRYSGMTLTQATAVTAGTLGLAGIIGTFWGGSLADRLLSRKGYRARIDMSVAMILAGSSAFLISWIVDLVPVRLALQFVGMVVISTVPPTLRASTMDVVPAGSRGVGSSAFAVVTALFGTAMAPAVVGWLSDLTSLRTAFLLVSPPIVAGTLILWRARFTIVEDAQKMVALLVAQRSEGS
jgi:MFS family permease